MQNVLVTGGAGFIGSNFIQFLLKREKEIRVINLDALTYAGSLANLKDLPSSERYIFIHGNICDHSLVEDVIRCNKVDTIIHFAAESHVDRSIVAPDLFIQTNIVGTFTLLEAIRRIWIEEKCVPLECARFHHVSTDEVFGSLGVDDPPFLENTPYAPNSPYSASKAASDHLVRSYYHTYCIPITISNSSNNYGPYQFPEKLIPLIILNAIEGKLLPVYGDGQQVRDWLYVLDHCEAIWLVVNHGRIGETYNIGGGNQPTNLEVVQTICIILDELFPDSQFVPHQSLIKFVKDRPGHDRRYAMNIDKIRSELRWQSHETIEDGLRKTVSWYLTNPDWLAAIKKKKGYQDWINNNYHQRGKASE